MDPQSGDSLCDFCKRISIETLDSPGGLKHAKVTGFKVARDVGCSLCHLLIPTKVSPWKGQNRRLFLKRGFYPKFSRLVCREGESQANVDEYPLFTDEGESDDVRIVNVKDLGMKYATLSYCWGDTMPEGSTTTLANIRDREDRLQIADLPQTLRDAINVTRWLAIRYLWIDAICIIQNSHEDWKIESAKMASITGAALSALRLS
ncbi:hypothetical protein ACEPPN_004901 [Leptodophora sp. 'Broadleaf-Isolate-01']